MPSGAPAPGEGKTHRLSPLLGSGTGTAVRWADEEELENFDALLDQAVDRCLALGPTAIYLSGGLDSISVAAVATDRARNRGLNDPLALSLHFPEPQSNEEKVQRGVARELGLSS